MGVHLQLRLPMMPAALLCVIIAAHAQSTMSFEDLVAKAAQAREQHDTAQAIALYREAVAANPKWPDGWWYLGSLEYATDDYARARDSLSHYIELKPNAGPALALRGLCEFETSEYTQSLSDIELGLSLGAANQPRNAQILRYHEAVLLTHAGRFEEALEHYKFFAKNGISDPDILTAIGLAGLHTRMVPKNIPAAQQDLLIAAGKATWTFMAGDTSGAQQAFQDLFQRYSSTENVHYLYSYLLFPIDPHAAILQLKEELQRFPANASASAMLAWAYLMQDDATAALPYAQKAVTDAPSQVISQLVLGKSLLDTGNADGGVAHLEKALEIEANNLEVHIALAKAYSELGRRNDARREREWCLRKTNTESHALP